MTAVAIVTTRPWRKKSVSGKGGMDVAPVYTSRNTSSPGAKEHGAKLAGAARTIRDLIEPRREKAIPSEHPDLPYIGLEHVESHSTRLLGSVPATQLRSTAKRFYSGDVLYSRLRPYLNKVWHADRDGLCSSEFIVMPGNDKVDSNFLRYRLNSSDFVRFANSLNAGDRPRVDFDGISSFILPPFSLAAQRAAVAEIEKHFTRLDAGVAGLRRVQANLKRNRAAVLKAACEGRLVPTEAELAKAENREFEGGEELLASILNERREKRQQHGKHKELVAPETANLSRLPNGWTWATIGQLAALVQYGSSAKTSEIVTGVPVLRMGNIQEGKIDFDKLKYLPKSHDEFPELLLTTGDLLFNRTNSAELVGKTAVFRGTPAACSFASYLIRLRLCDGCLPDWAAYYINSVFGRAWIAGCVSQQVGQANVNGTKLQALAIPLPPLAEQTRIVAEVERRLTVADELEAVVSVNLRRAHRLRESVLQRTFLKRI
jgi:type I restriction enzyme S subunit